MNKMSVGVCMYALCVAAMTPNAQRNRLFETVPKVCVTYGFRLKNGHVTSQNDKFSSGVSGGGSMVKNKCLFPLAH